MNQIVRIPEALAPSETLTTVRLGMPQLALGGLSELWLLKELGDLHWRMLARAAGRADPDFRTESGEPVYAAFCALALHDMRLEAAGEHDRLAIRSRIGRLSRTQVGSGHDLAIGGTSLGTVEMVSAFVYRRGTSNHTVARFEVPGLPPCPTSVAGDLAGAAAAHRAVRGTPEPAEGRRYAFYPCPALDFNGAGFLYFAAFVGFVERAEWAETPDLARRAVLRQRTIYFTGNLDPGERLDLDLARDAEAPGLAHRCRLSRRGLALAEVWTRKALQRSDR